MRHNAYYAVLTYGMALQLPKVATKVMNGLIAIAFGFITYLSSTAYVDSTLSGGLANYHIELVAYSIHLS